MNKRKERRKAMPKFYTQYNNYSKPSIPGEAETTEYMRKTDAVTGEIKIIKTGKRNIYNEIQEAGIGITLKEIISKYENNEIPETDRPYLDITDTPTDRAELQRMINTAEANLKKLKEYKAKEKTETKETPKDKEKPKDEKK